MIIQLIDEAVANGARREKAAALLGLSDRAVARWRKDASSDDRRKGPQAPHHRPEALRGTPEARFEVARLPVLTLTAPQPNAPSDSHHHCRI